MTRQKHYCTIYLVRHGESEANEKNLVGIPASHLSCKGLEQAKELTQKLKGVKFSAIFSSDFTRALDTAEILAKNQNLPVVVDKRLEEWNIGNLDGVSEIEFNNQMRIYYESNLTKEEKFNCRVSSEMETPLEVVNRLISFIKETAFNYPEKNILMVTHGAAMGFLLIQLDYTTFNDLPSWDTIIPNTGYVKLRTDGRIIKAEKLKGISKL